MKIGVSSFFPRGNWCHGENWGKLVSVHFSLEGGNWGEIGVSSFFLAGTAARAGVQVDAKAFGHAIGPVRRAERTSATQRLPHGGQLRFVLRAAHLGPPPLPTLGLGPTQLVPLGERAQQRIVVAQPVVREAGPPVLGQIGDHPRSERVRLDVAQDDQQVHVVLDHRALKSALPDVP